MYIKLCILFLKPTASPGNLPLKKKEKVFPFYKVPRIPSSSKAFSEFL